MKYVSFNLRFGPVADPVPECTPSYTLEDHIASLKDSDPEKWAALNAEWESGRG